MFWNNFTPDSHERLLSELVLKSGEFITREVMSMIYDMFCGMSKEEQRVMLSLAYVTKCWRENLECLTADTFACYSPSYAPEDSGVASESDLGTFYRTSTKVMLGVQFGCLRCAELSGIGQSNLKHRTNCPFTLHCVDDDGHLLEHLLDVEYTDSNDVAAAVTLACEDLSVFFTEPHRDEECNTNQMTSLDVGDSTNDGIACSAPAGCVRDESIAHENGTHITLANVEHQPKREDVSCTVDDAHPEFVHMTEEDCQGLHADNDYIHTMETADMDFDLVPGNNHIGTDSQEDNELADGLLMSSPITSFTSLHPLITKLMQLVTASINDDEPFISYSISKWNHCNFTGNEVLLDVCNALHLKPTLMAYFSFLVSIPMLNHLIRLNDTSNEGYVDFTMSVEAFKQYLNQTHCNVDYEVELCGYTTQSLQVCARCIANAAGRSTTEQHDISCDLLLTILPECNDAVNMDITESFVQQHLSCLTGRSILHHSSINDSDTHDAQASSIIELDDISYMFDTAIELAASGGAGVPRQPPPLLPSAPQVDVSMAYITLPFRDPCNGSINFIPLDRLGAVKVRLFCYLFQLHSSLCTFTCRVMFIFTHKHFSLQYCTQRGFVLVDTGKDLFKPFHCFMVNIADDILQCYEANPERDAVPELEEWKTLNFMGDESFATVCRMKGNVLLSLPEYMQFLLSLPHMNLFFNYSFMQTSPQCVFINFFMSVESFQSLNNDYHLMTNEDLVPNDTSSPLTHIVPTQLFCSPATTEVPKHFGSLQCQPRNEHVSRTTMSMNDETYEGGALAAEYFMDLVDEMYDKCFDVVNGGSAGIVLPPPMMAYGKTKQCYDSYMHATYIDPSTKNRYKRWITKEQAISVRLNIVLIVRLLCFSYNFLFQSKNCYYYDAIFTTSIALPVLACWLIPQMSCSITFIYLFMIELKVL